MAYDEDGIDVTLMPEPDQAQVYVSWTSDRPPGTSYQVYVDGRLYGVTRGLSATIPWPSGTAVVRVGSVSRGEEGIDFSAGMAPVPGAGSLVKVSWTGGRYLDPGPDGGYDDVVAFQVLASPGPGLPIATDPLATVPLFEGGFPQDGAGIGMAGRGGAGRSALSFRWWSRELASGVWLFSVRALDRAGNPGATIASISAPIVAAPRPPLADAQGRRLRASLTISGHVRLEWDQES